VASLASSSGGTRNGRQMARDRPPFARGDPKGSAGILKAMHEWNSLRRLCRAARFQHLLLLVGILPSLTFLGHWTVQFDIPGTNSYVLVVPGEAHDDLHEDVHTHESHCHASAATCTDIPFVGASPFALMHDSVIYLGVAAVLIVLGLNTWRPRKSTTVAPLLQPPQATWPAFPSAFA
jgi:hypothetical protein